MGSNIVFVLIVILFYSNAKGGTPPDSTSCIITVSSDNSHIQTAVSINALTFQKDLPKTKGDFLLLVTNRELVKSKHGILFSNHRTTTISYVSVFFKENRAYLVKQATLEKGLNILDTARPMVLYVHGYRKTFEAALSEGRSMSNLYEVSVVLFDWPCWYPEAFPLNSYRWSKSNARSSATQFSTFIKEFSSYLIQNPGKIAHTTLMLHSMGNILLETAVEKGHLPLSAKTLPFNNLILNAPAIAYKGHRKWLEKIKVKNRIYITTNSKDMSYFGLWFLTYRRALGGIKKPVSNEKATYVDFGMAAGKHHNYFLNPELLDQNPSIKSFYTRIFQGKNRQNCLDNEQETILSLEES